MKINGKTISKPKNEIVVIPRDGEDFVFEVQAVLDFKQFDSVCPEPQPVMKTNQKTGQSVKNITHPVYVEATKKYNENRINYMIIKSLEATDGIEWETVDMTDPSTWSSYEDELRDCGLTEYEMSLLVRAVMKVNGLSEEIYNEAKKRFLAGKLPSVQQ